MTNINASELELYQYEVFKLIDSASVFISNIKPSEWVEQNRMMTADVSPIPGMFSYKNSPYTREIIDCLVPDHPAKTIAVMKGAQIGFSVGVIEGGIGWIISQNPGNILFLVGHEDIVPDAMKKVDTMLDNSGIRHFIKSTSQRAKNNKSGDTDKMKEFSNGYLKLGTANHGILRQISMQYGFIDDYEKMKGANKSSGATKEMIEQRFAAYDKKKKLYYISTPELKEGSNIEPVYLLGDQRKYHIPCPCCGEFIYIEWEIKSEAIEGHNAGMKWQLDDQGELINESVEYECQKCGGRFDDRNKTELIRSGFWKPTAKPKDPEVYSYHISSLYAPTYMYGWVKYVRQYLDCHPIGEERDEEKYKTFVNLVLGETYSPNGKSVSATLLQKNIRNYDIGIIPELLSIEDGNGKIVMLTCGSDMNGTEDDARLDYEIVAHSETGATYSIEHGSIGTFIPKDKFPQKRKHLTYKHGATNSVWPIFAEIISRRYTRDSDGKTIGIFITGVDSGYQTNHAYQFVDNSKSTVISLKGDDYDKYLRENQDIKSYRKSSEKNKLYSVATNYTKNLLAKSMGLTWDKNFNDVQPYEFMNFPNPSEGKYLFDNYFSHFEAEHKQIDKKTKKYVWKKKTNDHQNHLFDCRLYAMVCRDIFMDLVLKEAQVRDGVWKDYVALALKKRVD